jgi:minichromosome maintenance protein 10
MPVAILNVPGPSNFLASLSSLRHNEGEDELNKLQRSSGFSASPLPVSSFNEERRDVRLQLIEQLEVGPIEHKPPPDDPEFKSREPNSGIYLK